MTERNREEEILDLQEVGAYATKHKPEQDEGPLLQEEAKQEPRRIEASADRAQ